jgi:hypothetical protein
MNTRSLARALVFLSLVAGCEDACDGEMTIQGVRERVGVDCGDPADGASFLSAGLFDLRAADLGYTAPLVVEGKLGLTLDSARIFFTDDTYGAVTTLPGVNGPRLSRFEDEIVLTAGQRSDVLAELATPSEARGMAEAFGGALVGAEDRARVLVWITLSGRLGEISSEATFPIDVCRGCLIGVDTVDGTRCLDEGEVLVEYEVCRRGQEELASRCE